MLTILSACIASILGLVYRVVQLKSNDNTWIVIPTWVTTYVSIPTSGSSLTRRLSIIEMTAGVIVCCMPTTNAIFKRFKTPLSSALTTYGRTWQRLYSSAATCRHEKIGNSSDLRPMHEMGAYPSNEVNVNVAKIWIGQEHGSSEWQPEREAALNIP